MGLIFRHNLLGGEDFRKPKMTNHIDKKHLEKQIGTFYGTLSGEGSHPLEPDSPYYVEVFNQDGDPIFDLAQRIKFAPSSSMSMFTGFRGNGKSTQLKRLKRLLEDNGCKVFLVDMLDYMIMTKPLELSDFILSLMASFAQATKNEAEIDEINLSYWERIKKLLNSELLSEGLEVQVGKTDIASAKLGLKLKTDPIFKERIQQHLRGRLTALVEEARDYVTKIVKRLREREHNEDLKVVLLVDSIEQLRGMGDDAQKVHTSVVETFSGQAANLAFDLLHIVYTIPPYLIPLAPNLARIAGSGNPIVSWPNIHVRNKDGSCDSSGTQIMQSIIEKRYSDWSYFFSNDQIHRIAQVTGGDIRDYFRIIRECLIPLSVKTKNKVTDDIIERAKQQLLKELTPIAIDDAQWLSRTHLKKDLVMDSTSDLPRITRLLDSNLIMNYQNGEPWYDIHPLIVDEIKKLSEFANNQ
jgi:energy-coupling factor transporter ATP-binding protein EcfA2